MILFKLLKSFFFALKLLSDNKAIITRSVKFELKNIYSGSILGYFWSILFPFLQLTIYAVLYTVIFRVRPSGLNEFTYTLLVFSGLVPILGFSASISASISSLTSNKNMLSSGSFPAELIPIKVAISHNIPYFFGMIITIIIGIALGNLYWSYLLIPLIWLLLLLFIFGLSWIFSLISLATTDLQYSIGLILTLLTVLSPFAYTKEMVPQTLKLIIYLNPLSYYVLSFQSIVVYKSLPDLIPFLGALLISFTTFSIGFIFFKRTKYTFFDYA